jgi:hypothetical protein
MWWKIKTFLEVALCPWARSSFLYVQKKAVRDLADRGCMVLKTNALRSVEKSGTTGPTTQGPYRGEIQSAASHGSKNLKSRMNKGFL